MCLEKESGNNNEEDNDNEKDDNINELAEIHNNEDIRDVFKEKMLFREDRNADTQIRKESENNPNNNVMK